jgi:hypothetical protein
VLLLSLKQSCLQLWKALLLQSLLLQLARSLLSAYSRPPAEAALRPLGLLAGCFPATAALRALRMPLPLLLVCGGESRAARAGLLARSMMNPEHRSPASCKPAMGCVSCSRCCAALLACCSSLALMASASSQLMLHQQPWLPRNSSTPVSRQLLAGSLA